MKFSKWLSLSASFAMIAFAQAGTLYTVSVSRHILQTFDTRGLTFTDVAALDVPFDFGDLTYDSTTGNMYMVQGFAGTNLYTLNLTTGHATLVGSHGFREMFGLAAVNGTLYAGRSTTGTGFYSLNKTTGAATFIGNMGGRT